MLAASGTPAMRPTPGPREGARSTHRTVTHAPWASYCYLPSGVPRSTCDGKRPSVSSAWLRASPQPCSSSGAAAGT